MAEEPAVTSENLELPYLKNLLQPLAAKSSVSIEGTVLENASTFAINFFAPVSYCCCCRRETGQKDVAFNLSSYFDRKCIIRNSTRKLAWQTEEVTGNQIFPLSRGSSFSAEIFITGKEFLVAFNGLHYCTFQLKTSLNSIDSLEITGDIKLKAVSFRNEQTVYPDGSPEVTSPSVRIEDEKLDCHDLKMPLICNLSKSLENGNVIRIEGKVKMLPYSFFVNLQSSDLKWPDPSVLLHINGRYSYSQKKNERNLLLCNSWVNNSWGTEKRVSNGCLPIPGNIFELRIICEEDHFKVSIDEITMNFPYNSTLQNAKVIYVQGDVYVYSITFS